MRSVLFLLLLAFGVIGPLAAAFYLARRLNRRSPSN